jgi:hypothetical protein
MIEENMTPCCEKEMSLDNISLQTCSGWKGNTYIRTRSPSTFVKEKDKEVNLDRIFFLKKDLYHKCI